MTLIDNKGQKKIVYLKPGEMLLYESAKVPHGRQFPLEGEYYDIKLVHFHLMDKEAWLMENKWFDFNEKFLKEFGKLMEQSKYLKFWVCLFVFLQNIV